MFKPTQYLATILSGAMIASSIPVPAGAFGEPGPALPAFVKTFTPAEELGYVASSYSPTHETTRPRMIIIADLHGHVEVQHKIVNMLDSLVGKLTSGTDSQSQAQVPIFVEGGWVDHLEHPLKLMTNAKTRSTMAEYLLEKAEIPATQAFSERYPNATNFTLTGVENKDEYEANRARFVESYPVRRALLEAIVRREQALSDVTNGIEVRDYRALQTLRSKYEKGLVSDTQYASKLARYARHYGVRNNFVTILQNASTESANRLEVALQEVNREVALQISESRPFMSYLRHNGGENAVLRSNIAKIDGYLDLLKRLIGDQLTPAEVPLAFQRLADLTQVAELLLADSHLNIDIADGLRHALAFYPFAMARDNSLIENSLTALNKKSPTGTGILVVGGFHTGAIGDYLRDHKIPYMLIDPAITRDISAVEQLNYAKRVCDDHVTTEEIIADFNAPEDKQAMNASDSAMAPDTNLASVVNPIVAVAKTITEALSPTTGEVKKTADGVIGNDGTGGAMAGGRVALAGLLGTTINGVHLILQKNGKAKQSAAIQGADALTRAAAVQDVMKGFNAKLKFNANNGATITSDGHGSYSYSGAQADNVRPAVDGLIDYLNKTNNTQLLPEKAHIVLMDENAKLDLQLNLPLWMRFLTGVMRVAGHFPGLKKLQEKADKMDPRSSTSQRAFVRWVADGTKNGTAVIFLNKNFTADQAKVQSGFVKASRNEALLDDEKAALQGQRDMYEELIHAFTPTGREGHLDEGATAALSLFMMFRMAAGTSKFIAAQTAANILGAFEGHVENAHSVYAMLENTATKEGHALDTLLDKLKDSLNVSEQRQGNEKELVDLVTKMKARFPKLTPYQIQAAVTGEQGLVKSIISGTSVERRVTLALAEEEKQDGWLKIKA